MKRTLYFHGVYGVEQDSNAGVMFGGDDRANRAKVMTDVVILGQSSSF